MRPFLRRLGRVVFYGLALLAITGCATLLYFRYVQHRRSGEAQRLLDQADGLAWNNQWLKAEPVYQRAERLFHQKNDPSRAAVWDNVARMGTPNGLAFIRSVAKSPFLPCRSFPVASLGTSHGWPTIWLTCLRPRMRTVTSCGKAK
jgi:hypothetical protein